MSNEVMKQEIKEAIAAGEQVDDAIERVKYLLDKLKEFRGNY